MGHWAINKATMRCEKALKGRKGKVKSNVIPSMLLDRSSDLRSEGHKATSVQI